GSINRRRLIGAGLTTGVSALFLAACSGNSTNNGGARRTATATSAASTAGAAGTAAAAPRAASPAAGAAGAASPAAAASASAPVAGNVKRGGRLQIVIDYGDHKDQEVQQDATGETSNTTGLAYSQLIRPKYGPNINPGEQI